MDVSSWSDSSGARLVLTHLLRCGVRSLRHMKASASNFNHPLQTLSSYLSAQDTLALEPINYLGGIL